MLRESNDLLGLNESAGTRSVSIDASAPCSQHLSSFQPITFVDELLINGRNLRVAIPDLPPGQVRSLQCITELARSTGGFRVFGAGPLVRACIQFGSIRDVYSARLHVMQLRNQLIGLVNTMNPTLTSGGGGCKDIDAQVCNGSAMGSHLEIAVIVELPDRTDVRAVDILIAKFAPLIEQLTHGARSGASVRDIADRQVLCAQVTFDPERLSLAATPGLAMAGRIVDLHNFTCVGKERISARNADVLATANSMLGAIASASGSADSSRNAWIAHDDHGVPLAIWYRDHHGHLSGRISLPVLADQAGAATRMTSTQTAAAATAQSTDLLNPAVAAIGLTQSLASLHAHAATEIAQRNPAQHAYDLALLVGARGSEIAQVVKALLSKQSVRCDLAIAVLDKLRGR